MTNQDNIEKLFKEKFRNFEADVNPNVWANVQSGISSGVGSAAGTAAKFALGKIIAGAVAVTGIAGSVWYFSHTENKTTTALPERKNKTEVVSPSPNTENNLTAENNPTANSSATQSEKKNSPVVHSSNQSANDNSVKNNSSSGENASSTVPSSDNSSATLSAESHKYGNASKDDGGMVRWNKYQSPKTNSSKDNSSASGKESSNNVNENNSSEPEDISKTESKPVSRIDSIPNAFTPNGDGYDDYFYPLVVKNISSIEVTITDTKGRFVYKWKTIDGNWNGKLMNGSDAPEGVYLYFIQASGTDGIPHVKKGSVTLYR
ncbi:MAG: gliding motility-associated C-terminal domain-containing protein [Bacteroidetes bacterium]|nr:gliding motility-associated C-terminal domain-containing protein [Bacteroidota bacterium]